MVVEGGLTGTDYILPGNLYGGFGGSQEVADGQEAVPYHSLWLESLIRSTGERNFISDVTYVRMSDCSSTIAILLSPPPPV